MQSRIEDLFDNKPAEYTEQHIELFTQCLGGKQCRFASSDHHHSLVVKGPTPLKAKDISIPDLRAGFAYVMAALLVPEVSTISNVDYLDRGYEDLVNKLTSVGADITRVPVPGSAFFTSDTGSSTPSCANTV